MEYTRTHTHTKKNANNQQRNHQQFIITDPPKDHEHESKSREHSTFEYFSWVNQSIEIHRNPPLFHGFSMVFPMGSQLPAGNPCGHLGGGRHGDGAAQG